MKSPLFVVSLVLLLCFAFGCQNKAEKAELEKFRAQAKVEEQNKEIVRDFYNALDKGDFDRLKALSSDDFAFKAPGLDEPLGRDAIFQVIKTHYTAFPDWKHVIEDIIAEGGKVTVKITQNGTHKAEYEGIPATDKKVILPAMFLLTIVDGKIKEAWDVEDYLGLYQQLGMELKPKEVKK